MIALYVAGEDFSVSAAIGFISLAGVTMMDGIVNIPYFRELLTCGSPVSTAPLPNAASLRLSRRSGREQEERL